MNHISEWSFYDKLTGFFSHFSYCGRWSNLAINTPDGFVAIEGSFDRFRQKFDISSGFVIEYIPEKPVDTPLEVFVWSESDWRWIPEKTRLAFEKDERERRDEMLSLTDWTQLSDAPLTAVELQAWRSYRQALRDVTEQHGFPMEITWPEPPQF